MSRVVQMIDFGPQGVIKIEEVEEEGQMVPLVTIFAGAEQDGTPVIIQSFDGIAIEALIKLGRALSAWNQGPPARGVQDSSGPRGLTINPI